MLFLLYAKTKILTTPRSWDKIKTKKFAANNTVNLFVNLPKREGKKSILLLSSIFSYYKRLNANERLLKSYFIKGSSCTPKPLGSQEHSAQTWFLFPFSEVGQSHRKCKASLQLLTTTERTPPPMLQAPHYQCSSCLLYRDITRFHSDTWSNTRSKSSPWLQCVMQHRDNVNAVKVIATIYRLIILHFSNMIFPTRSTAPGWHQGCAAVWAGSSFKHVAQEDPNVHDFKRSCKLWETKKQLHTEKSREKLKASGGRSAPAQKPSSGSRNRQKEGENPRWLYICFENFHFLLIQY